ncbi:DUS3 [Lepeophtheirus salmonis]|uniref:tRNA-dihydrouridine(47) synthase [NAD(P)(+)] n=1 Tax=Lepeophtheirus salmonis TaxID=72036 RepID=A0A7R8CD10_LEPSM|nr:DUS3 [Lepeophtheirus salmonis]CAF2776449.1 DUS3 [Lepeophtheirus salmonis]
MKESSNDNEDIVDKENKSGGLECHVKPEYLLPVPEDINKSRGQIKTDQAYEKRGVDVPTCQYPQCAFLHNVEEYIKVSESSQILDRACHVYETYGFCPRGLTCKFRKDHVSEISPGDWRNLRNMDLKSMVSNKFDKNVQIKLRKKDFDFHTEDKIVDMEFKAREARLKQEVESKPEIESIEIHNKEEDESIESVPCKIPRLEYDENHPKLYDISAKKKIDWEKQVVFSSSNHSWEIYLFVGFDRVLNGLFLKKTSSEDIFGVQLCGCSPQQMARAAKVVQEYSDVDFIDINMGCPIDMVYKKRSMKQILDIPLTIKIRTGVYADKRLAHSLIPEVIDWGVDLITLHGRSREQRYTREANWGYIKECVNVANKQIPIYGNGDIMDFESYNHQKSISGVNGVMIARGALIKPWIFSEIKEQRHLDISASDRLDMIKDYVNYGFEHWGSDDRGIETIRRFLLEWLSFLHRYVPTGLLLHPPQKINERIPYFKGRDQMETLMSSPNFNTSLIKFHFDRTHHKSCSKITFNPLQGGVFEWKEVYESANVFHPIFILFLDPHAYITYVHIRFIHPCLWEDNYRDSLREGLEVFSVSHKDMEYLKQEKQTLVKPKDFVDDYVLIEKQFNCYRKVGAASALVLYFKDDFKFGFHILSISLVIDSLIEERYTIDGANICKWNTDLIPLFERSLYSDQIALIFERLTKIINGPAINGWWLFVQLLLNSSSIWGPNFNKHHHGEELDQCLYHHQMLMRRQMKCALQLPYPRNPHIYYLIPFLPPSPPPLPLPKSPIDDDNIILPPPVDFRDEEPTIYNIPSSCSPSLLLQALTPKSQKHKSTTDLLINEINELSELLPWKGRPPQYSEKTKVLSLSSPLSPHSNNSKFSQGGNTRLCIISKRDETSELDSGIESIESLSPKEFDFSPACSPAGSKTINNNSSFLTSLLSTPPETTKSGIILSSLLNQSTTSELVSPILESAPSTNAPIHTFLQKPRIFSIPQRLQ